MKEGYENITPKMAEQMLNANTQNRPLRPGRAEKMAEDMRDKAWTNCLVPIVFYDNGALADGQHRLWAIIMSGETVRFRVVRGLPLADGVNIDTGESRTPVDVMRIQGLDNEMTPAIAAVARGIEDGNASGVTGTRTVHQALEILTKHREAAHWASSHGPYGRGLRNAAVLAAIGRAYYVVIERERLAHFGKILSKGFIDTSDDSAAVAMRNYLQLKVQQGINTSRSKYWRDTFLKTQNALYHFMRHQPLTQIKVVTDESYPLPDLAATKAPTTQQGRARAGGAKRALKKRK